MNYLKLLCSMLPLVEADDGEAKSLFASSIQQKSNFELVTIALWRVEPIL